MARESNAGRKQRDTDDQARDRAVYRYLLNLTEFGELAKGETPNETNIAKQWGVEDNRIFVRRVLRSVLYKELYEEKGEEQKPVPGLTLSKLVNILSALQNYQQQQQSLDGKSKRATAIVTRLEKLKVLQLFAQLSPGERSRLKLEAHPEKVLLDQILEKATDQAEAYTANDVIRLYRFFLQQLSERSIKSMERVTAQIEGSSGTSQLNHYISEVVARYTEQYSRGLSPAEKKERDDVFASKVSREIERIEIQSGAEPAHTFLKHHPRSNLGDSQAKHLTPEFIQRLAHSVIDNELLTDEFPIHIKHFEIERVRPLPLYIKDDSDPRGLLNSAFVPDGTEPNSVEGLANQVAYRVRVHFYVKTPAKFKPRFDDITVFRETAGQHRLEFSEEVVGVGCITSHVIAVINRVLLWDIPVLKDYLPIAEGIHCNDEVMGGKSNSPVWSHCVARLYKRQDIRKAIASNIACTEAATTAEVASADFCGFDLLETVSKAALFARLKLIKQTLAVRPNVTAKQYIQQLCARIEEMTALKKARSLLDSYPFSLKAMEGQLETTIFEGKYRRRLLPDLTFKQRTGPWSVVAIEAHLSIAEANLKEGLFKVAKRYLDALPPDFQSTEKPPSELLLARYHLCLFRYYYLSDLDDPNCSFPDRYVAVRKAEEALEKAEDYLQQRLQHYAKLDELTQSNLNPQFYFLSRVYAHRAKLHIFFPNYMTKQSRWDRLLAPIKLLEKARIYAARDGAPVLYAQWSAYQAWCYIILAYLGKSERSPSKKASDASHDESFTAPDCLDWAARLVEHAEICYSPTGKHCYQQIKDSGGRITDYLGYPTAVSQMAEAEPELEGNVFKDNYRNLGPKHYEKYGSTMIEVVPLVQELFQNEGAKYKQRYKRGNHVVRLDLELLKRKKEDESSSIYLFGMQAGILLFAQGILSLCKRYDSHEDLLDAIDKKAMRMMQYCCAVTSDGAQEIKESEWPEGTDPHSIVLDRVMSSTQLDDDPHSADRLLQCFYPHRFTHFADLSKVFIIVCRLILLVATKAVQDFLSSKQAWKDIDASVVKEIERVQGLVKELRQNNRFNLNQSHACGQVRYNGQFAEHHIQFEQYINRFIEALQDKRIEESNSLDLRDRLVTDVFRILQGETNV